MIENSKFAVVVLDIVIDNSYFHRYEKLNWADGKKICLESMEKYCEKYQLDFVKIDTIKIVNELDENFTLDNKNIDFQKIVLEKFQVRDVLKKYDRILYLDTDCFIHKDTENIFDTNNNLLYMCLTPSSNFMERGQSTWNMLCKKNNVQIPFVMHNGGIFTMSKKHIKIFDYIDKFGKDLLLKGNKCVDQTFITSVSSHIYYNTMDIDFDITPLPIKFRNGKRNNFNTKGGIEHFAGIKAKTFLMNNINNYSRY